MGVPLLPDTIDAVANRIAAGQANAEIGRAMGLSRNSLAGIVNRLRKRGEAAEFVEACLAGDCRLASCLAPRLFKGEALARIDAALVRRVS